MEKIKDFIILIVEELLKYYIFDDRSTYQFAINGSKVIPDSGYIKFESSSLDKVKDMLSKSSVNSFNFTVTLKDTSEIWREDYPSNWFTSDLIFCGGEYNNDCEKTDEVIGLMRFSSNNVSLDYGRDREKKLENKEDLEIFVKNLIDLHKFYVSVTNEISEKLYNMYK